MRTVALSVALFFGILPLASAFGQTWSLPSKRLGVGTTPAPSLSLTNPTVFAPYATIFLDDPVAPDTATDSQSSDSDELIAYGAAGANAQTPGGVGSAQTTGRADCNTAIDGTEFVPAVETLVTALIELSDDMISMYTGGGWATGAVGATQFQVQNNPSFSAVSTGNLTGYIWLLSDQEGTYTSGSAVNFGATVQARVGASDLSAVYLGNGNGWYLSGTLTQTTSSNPNANPINYDDYVPTDSIDEFHSFTEFIAVPSSVALGAAIWNGVFDFFDIPQQGDIRASGYILEPGEITASADVTLKADAYYSVTN